MKGDDDVALYEGQSEFMSFVIVYDEILNEALTTTSMT